MNTDLQSWLSKELNSPSNMTSGGIYYIVWTVTRHVVITDDNKTFEIWLDCNNPEAASEKKKDISRLLKGGTLDLWTITGKKPKDLQKDLPDNTIRKLIRYENGRCRACNIPTQDYIL